MLSILVQLAHTWLHLPSPENSPKLWHLPMPKPGTSSLHGCSTPYNLHTTKQNGLKLLSQTFKALIKFKTMQCILNHSFYGLPKSKKKKNSTSISHQTTMGRPPLVQQKRNKGTTGVLRNLRFCDYYHEGICQTMSTIVVQLIIGTRQLQKRKSNKHCGHISFFI